MSEVCTCGAILHPDLRQVWCKKITDAATAYEIYPDGAYVLRARLSPAIGTTEFEVFLFTSPSPLSAGDDEAKIPLYVGVGGVPDDYPIGENASGGGVFFENGIYARADSTVAADLAYLQVEFIPRRHNCAAFPKPEEELLACWDAARNVDENGKPIPSDDPRYETLYDNFTVYERDNPEEDSGSSGGSSTTGIPIT